ncbi:MAG TPA: TIGR04053 family radical SAM/SPASM domain-containing protein [Candidatus Binatia bacterium]|nr:TIGR04053 family radical SAM/SPASM domain-containing protein [Candidatus Binatia bacterium]
MPHPFAAVDFHEAPFLVIWETTRACELACTHCRASARPERDPGELTTAEGERLLAEVAAMGTPVFILSGGDPVRRPDLLDLVRSGKARGLRMGTIPAAVPSLDEDVIRALRDAGLDQMALSLDFPHAPLHDAFRGVPGAFERTMRAVEWAHAHELPLQINTTVCGASAPFLGEMADLVARLGIVFWEVFFLVPVGRGAALAGLAPAQCEALFAVLHAVQERSHFVVKVTEAPHYRRYVAQREAPGAGVDGAMPRLLRRSEGPGQTVGLAPRGVNAGNGFAFVSHTGDVFPSGFLPLCAGNVRERPLAEIYRSAPLFRALRDPDRLLGRCGRCEYRHICGGSRSRALALTGNAFATDPWCAYRPAPR